jgi:hypothetical protein
VSDVADFNALLSGDAGPSHAADPCPRCGLYPAGHAGWTVAVEKFGAKHAAAMVANGELECPVNASPTVAGLLGEVYEQVTAYVAFPTSHAAVAIALFILATHAQSAWEHATRAVVKSPLKRCGKTRLLEVCSGLVHQPIRTTNISTAALVRAIDEDDPPCLILDEADTIFTKKRTGDSENAESLRGILNAGHSRGWPYIRWDPRRNAQEECATFAMAAIAAIGDLPDTIEDRAVVIGMRRRAPGEMVKQWRTKRAVPTLHALRDRLHEAMRDHLDELENADPELPVEDRAADVWAPLVAVADLAGGDWPQRARDACRALTASGDPEADSASERLLADLKGIFADADQFSTAHLLDQLHALEEAPWADWFGNPLMPRGLANLLRPYGVRSRTIRPVEGDIAYKPGKPAAEQGAKGYLRADLADPWARYVPVESDEPPPTDDVHDSGGEASQASQASQPDSTGAEPLQGTNRARDGYVTDTGPPSVTDESQVPHDNPGSRDGVTDVTAPRQDEDTDQFDGIPVCPSCGVRNTSSEPVHPTCPLPVEDVDGEVVQGTFASEASGAPA